MARPEVASREQLLEAAARILANDGLGALSTRRLANELGVSTMVVYTRFGSMPELLDAVVSEGFDRQAARLQAVGESDDAVADLVELGIAYRANAIANPHLYSIMYAAVPTDDAAEHQHRTDQARSTFEFLVAATTRAAETLGAGDPEVIAGQLWSSVHGFVSLELAGVFANEPDAVERTLRPMLVSLLSGQASRVS